MIPTGYYSIAEWTVYDTSEQKSFSDSLALAYIYEQKLWCIIVLAGIVHQPERPHIEHLTRTVANGSNLAEFSENIHCEIRQKAVK